MYTYDNTRYKNSLDYNEYKKWNTDVAIDLLIKREFSISFFPQVEMRLCRAYQPFCCKFFANGKIGLCDASIYNDGLVDISVINDNYRRINQIFKEQKMYSPFNEEACKNCKEIIMCEGRYFCKNNPCDYERYVLETFLKKYINYREKGLGHYFTGIYSERGMNKDESNYQ